MKVSLRIAKDAADAAKTSAEALVSQLRAYVSVVSAKIYGFDQDGSPRVQICIRNTGQTPAFEMTNETGVTVRDASVTRFKGELWPDKRATSLSKGSLGPHLDSYSDNDNLPVLSAEQRTALKDGRTGLFAYGEILYKDAFGKDRHTKYRLMFGGGAETSGGQFVLCEEGNDQD